MTAFPPGVGSGFRLLLDIGCFHGLSDRQREAFGAGASAVAALDGTLLLPAWASRPALPRRASRAEIEAAFHEWRLIDEDPVGGGAAQPLQNVVPPLLPPAPRVVLTKTDTIGPMADEPIKIVVSRHSAFYSPLIAVVAGGFLEKEGLEATYRPLRPGESSRDLLASGKADVMQSAVGSNWGPLEVGETDLPAHFAQINTRDGFFLLARRGSESFRWSDLEGRTLLADHGRQPLLMLRYAVAHQGVDWSSIVAVDAGDPEAMIREFREGRGDFAHLQGPAPQQLQVERLGGFAVSVGQAMPPVAFSSLCARRDWLETEQARVFTRAYRQSREWVRHTPAAEVAAREAEFFPGVPQEALAGAIAEYQVLGCWEGELAIPRNLYDQALEVFLAGGAISRRHLYEDVVAPPPA